MRLDGARVLVTGASSGIGWSLARAMAARGAVLVVSARRVDRLEELAEVIVANGGTRPLVVPADLAVRGEARGLVERAVAGGAGLDVLINNAGSSVVGPQTLLSDTDRARAVFETNLWSPLALTAAVAPMMRSAGRGVIVNINSTTQAVPIPLLAYYGASKAAFSQATRALAHELNGTGVAVLEVIPGGVETDLRDVDTLPWKQAPPPTIPPISPERMAAAILRAITRGSSRLVYPPYSLAPIELPVIGRVLAAAARTRVDTLGALDAGMDVSVSTTTTTTTTGPADAAERAPS